MQNDNYDIEYIRSDRYNVFSEPNQSLDLRNILTKIYEENPENQSFIIELRGVEYPIAIQNLCDLSNSHDLSNVEQTIILLNAVYILCGEAMASCESGLNSLKTDAMLLEQDFKFIYSNTEVDLNGKSVKISERNFKMFLINSDVTDFIHERFFDYRPILEAIVHLENKLLQLKVLQRSLEMANRSSLTLNKNARDGFDNRTT